jgi:hypothetical protein
MLTISPPRTMPEVKSNDFKGYDAAVNKKRRTQFETVTNFTILT